MIFHRTKILSVHLSVAYPGEGPPYFKTKWNWGPKRPKKNFLRPVPQPKHFSKDICEKGGGGSFVSCSYNIEAVWFMSADQFASPVSTLWFRWPLRSLLKSPFLWPFCYPNISMQFRLVYLLFDETVTQSFLNCHLPELKERKRG